MDRLPLAGGAKRSTKAGTQQASVLAVLKKHEPYDAFNHVSRRDGGRLNLGCRERKLLARRSNLPLHHFANELVFVTEPKIEGSDRGSGGRGEVAHIALVDAAFLDQPSANFEKVFSTFAATRLRGGRRIRLVWFGSAAIYPLGSLSLSFRRSPSAVLCPNRLAFAGFENNPCIIAELELQFYISFRQIRRMGGQARKPRTTAHERKAMTEVLPQKGAWAIVALLFLFMLINFADKAIIGLAGVPIMADLNLSPRQFGLVGSSFFLLFSISAVVTGFVVNRVRSKWVLLTMGLFWALVQLPMIGTVGIELLIACRIVLGAAEGPAYPVALHALYKWFPDQKRAVPSAIVVQGGGIGVLVAFQS